MEVEFFSNAVSEEDTVEVDLENDNFDGKGERCGICMDLVIDRGLLDCCQHWFCFVCIDNWATITNLCPLCQNEFQLITCVPVYDTICCSKTEEDLDLRYDNWRVEEKNNTLCFPSYYIDENAVTCLDEDGCKIRSGSVNLEENLTLDTSIACDSCDIWYHAFCVGFDPDGTEVESWLCPRCLVSEVEQKSDLKVTCGIKNQLNSENAEIHRQVDTYSGKVFISVVDAGETAVVVSSIHEEHVAEDQAMDVPRSEDSTSHHEVGPCVLGPDSCSSELKISLDQRISTGELVPIVSSARRPESIVKSEPIENESSISLNLESSLEEEKSKIPLDGDDYLLDISNKNISADDNLEDIRAVITPKKDQKRKRTDYSFLTNDMDAHDGVAFKSGPSAKKAKAQQVLNRTSLIDKTRPDNFQKTNKLIESSAGEKRENMSEETSGTDIMSIVRGTEPRKTNRVTHQKEVGKCGQVEMNAAKLRVKKIMRRPVKDKESADVVQELRKEIREAIRKKPSDDVGKSVLDPNLLAAFRAAVTGSATAPVNKAPVKAKKFMLQKRKIRENLTKKIYATSGGRRLRAWDRDCEIEFWKHRCTTVSKSEKIETLKSVLKLLRQSPEDEKVEGKSEEQAKTPLLSRLYVADASLFPRKDDIKPLSVLKATSSKRKGESCSGEKYRRACPYSDDCKTSTSNGVSLQSNSSTADNNTGIHDGIASVRLQAEKQPNQKKMTGKFDDKVDKKKWALEVLARKTASNSTTANHQNQDICVLKSNCPLLAELPKDMWPKPVQARHNKIPISVRQVQLDRLTEQFLKMANLSSIRRTAATELAVADAVNIEKQIADRCNSKAVYLNLCSQEIRHCMNCNDSSMVVESTPTSPSPVSAEVGQSSFNSLDSEAEAALRGAGLLSNSPPSRPHHNIEHPHSNGNPIVEAKEEGVEDVLEMDSNLDLDIYGDFEYDLEEDLIDASTIKASDSQAEEGESKVKVVFSTLASNRKENTSDVEGQDSPNTGLRMCTESVLGSCVDVGGDGKAIADEADSVRKFVNSSLGGEGEVLSLAECEALYGPEKEPIVEKFLELSLVANVAHRSKNHVEVMNYVNMKIPDCHGDAVGGKPPSSSQSVENAQEKTSNPKVDKNSEHTDSVLKKVEAYIKEHIRPLCKSGVITVEQYRWAVGKTVDKVMKYHSKAKNANFLIKEGEKVKKLAEQYVESAKQKEETK